MTWPRDFGTDRDLEISEYFVYCGLFKAKSRGERSGQGAKEYSENCQNIFMPAAQFWEDTDPLLGAR